MEQKKMTADEQAARRALKLERKALERSHSKRTVKVYGVEDFPSRMGYMRRAHHAAVQNSRVDRELRQRIGAIDSALHGAA